MLLKLNSHRSDISPRISLFSTPYGIEAFLTLEVQKGNNVMDDIRLLLEQYSSCLNQYGLSADTEIYIRFYLSNISNEAALLHQCLSKRDVSTFYSIVGQLPVSGNRIAMESYHINSEKPIMKTNISADELLVHHGQYKSLWMRNVSKTAGSSEQETREIFSGLSRKLRLKGALLKDDVIRTWCYINNIEENYHGFVKARREYFASIGLVQDTHTVASTGIGAYHEGAGRLVSVDSLAVLGLDPAQIEYMSAPDNMSSTFKYNVTFERGTKITYGDRTHLYISGTASIDKDGNVLYPGNIEQQTLRILENIKALLVCQGADLCDMKMLVVYLQDPIEFDYMHRFLKDILPRELPYIVVRGEICRPTWLVEMDGIALSPAKDKKFLPFC